MAGKTTKKSVGRKPRQAYSMPDRQVLTKKLGEALRIDGILLSAANAVGLPYGTAFDWLQISETLQACQEYGKQRFIDMMDEQASEAALGKRKLDPIHARMLIYTTKAKAGWSDKQTIEHTGKVDYVSTKEDSNDEGVVLSIVNGGGPSDTGGTDPDGEGSSV